MAGSFFRLRIELHILSYTLLSSVQTTGRLTVMSLDLGFAGWFVSGALLSFLNGMSQTTNSWSAAATTSVYAKLMWVTYCLAPLCALILTMPSSGHGVKPLQKRVGKEEEETTQRYFSVFGRPFVLGALVHTLADAAGFALVGSTQMKFIADRLPTDLSHSMSIAQSTTASFSDKQKSIIRCIQHVESMLLRTWIKLIVDFFLGACCSSLPTGDGSDTEID